LLLKFFQRVQIALGGIAVVAGFHQLSIEAEYFLLGSASLRIAQVGLRRFQLGLGASRLRARFGVIQNEKQLPLLDGFAFLDQNAPHTGRSRSVGLEIIDRLNFSVGRNQAADIALLDDGGSHRNRVVTVGNESSQHNHRRQNRERRYPPAPRPAFRTVSIQCHSEKKREPQCISSTRGGEQGNARSGLS
jgi:hypothetical protein